jgi:predicted nuclease of predicted toxin-antitoxin system
MRILIDMNLAPAWGEVFQRQGWVAVHWSTTGDPHATDQTIMSWARENGHVVFTHDLDFGTLLAVSGAEGPSVIQVRAQDVMPTNLEGAVVTTIRTYEAVLEAGALITIDEARARIRILPIGRES